MNHLADLPNVENFRFIGVTHDLEKVECIVQKNPVGCHGVYTLDGEPCWFKLTGWEQKEPT